MEEVCAVYHESVILSAAAAVLIPVELGLVAGAVRGCEGARAVQVLEAAVVRRAVLRVPQGRRRPFAELPAVGVEAGAVP